MDMLLYYSSSIRAIKKLFLYSKCIFLIPGLWLFMAFNLVECITVNSIPFLLHICVCEREREREKELKNTCYLIEGEKQTNANWKNEEKIR